MFKVITCLILIVVCVEFGATRRYARQVSRLPGGGDGYERPMPYNFQYDTVDEYGTQLTRQETGDESGAVRGSYSYRDPDGVYRVVDYIADQNGFRATVRTNEPGTAKDHSGDPADTTWEIAQPPAGVVEKWTRGSRTAAAVPSYGPSRPGRVREAARRYY
ncbi:cuticle protein-like protein [Dinothrombium tinctorium]|uniref:Cuticle protein-like protein n=1 Tax=Dinothrombium tinctorium TaxID=1965070 RepID=A0A3S3PL72_9ACAR|nr:cuticle protein-like protein [Dinothrombium tinctorium]RWS17580.1 cuticle protein-like protein [Dinothrombium tinctorium]RWS17661.1 cuticle protein-like protein [Dinothrombium tinctorium]